MKQKASLTLIEVALMLLVFSLAAAFCIRGFVWADQHSAYQEKADRALEQAQLAAEWIKHSAGDLSRCQAQLGGTLSAAGWQLHSAETGFTLLAQKQPADIPGLGCVRIEVLDAQGERLALLEVCYQEVAAHG